MLPLRDNIPSRSLPLVNLTLIAINVLVFIYQMTLEAMLGVRFFYFLDSGQENINYL